MHIVWHKEFAKTKDGADLSEAAAAYTLVTRFPNANELWQCYNVYKLNNDPKRYLVQEYINKMDRYIDGSVI